MAGWLTKQVICVHNNWTFDADSRSAYTINSWKMKRRTFKQDFKVLLLSHLVFLFFILFFSFNLLVMFLSVPLPLLPIFRYFSFKVSRSDEECARVDAHGIRWWHSQSVNVNCEATPVPGSRKSKGPLCVSPERLLLGEITSSSELLWGAAEPANIFISCNQDAAICTTQLRTQDRTNGAYQGTPLISFWSGQKCVNAGVVCAGVCRHARNHTYHAGLIPVWPDTSQ